MSFRQDSRSYQLQLRERRAAEDDAMVMMMMKMMKMMKTRKEKEYLLRPARERHSSSFLQTGADVSRTCLCQPAIGEGEDANLETTSPTGCVPAPNQQRGPYRRQLRERACVSDPNQSSEHLPKPPASSSPPSSSSITSTTTPPPATNPTTAVNVYVQLSKASTASAFPQSSQPDR
ncbi:hypothetical protein H072_3013 [Dactylellina haptotyla CBS 200.50]|uniref:Uncharacterized protein n=1 Tax=Dactylellina haptotyla (strain CBS 200.50) TaxID=1284197 RepID=S8APH4_DACHA|nr:hypothetical protein H072_3013 [Dactylellina haptotyla CBS 200.50]